jgi:hypothetical protein
MEGRGSAEYAIHMIEWGCAIHDRVGVTIIGYSPGGSAVAIALVALGG